MKRPRIVWTDPGLAAHLCGYFDVDAVRVGRELGTLFETLVFFHVSVLARALTPRARLAYWRTHDGREVDIVVEHGRRSVAIEVKSTDSPGYRHMAGLRAFLDEHEDAVAGVLVCRDDRVRRFDERIVSVPWTLVAGNGDVV